mmetsp:Transcript_26907/g.41721  ORF Transcript_26907/g.41721 Transcript_26907/m.41721 type:complete len:99 (+) Transcript_26907:515-811(+)
MVYIIGQICSYHPPHNNDLTVESSHYHSIIAISSLSPVSSFIRARTSIKKIAAFQNCLCHFLIRRTTRRAEQYNGGQASVNIPSNLFQIDFSITWSLC